MAFVQGYSVALCLSLALVIGCSRAPPPPTGTGAAETAKEYYHAVIHRDWQRAYELLHPETRARLSFENYYRWADAYRQRLKFDPETIHVQACEEHGDEAIVYLVLTAGPVQRQFRHKDAAALRRAEGSWRVIATSLYAH
jgi:hypothetical protein